jgi:hypothetical protein
MHLQHSNMLINESTEKTEKRKKATQGKKYFSFPLLYEVNCTKCEKEISHCEILKSFYVEVFGAGAGSSNFQNVADPLGVRLYGKL